MKESGRSFEFSAKGPKQIERKKGKKEQAEKRHGHKKDRFRTTNNLSK